MPNLAYASSNSATKKSGGKVLVVKNKDYEQRVKTLCKERRQNKSQMAEL